jgi:hypothetical protein
MIVYVLLLITSAYATPLSSFPSYETCMKGAEIALKAIKAPPVTVKAPTVLCLPKVVISPSDTSQSEHPGIKLDPEI